VTAVDINTVLLELLPAQNLTMGQLDVRTGELPAGAYDLVTCRALLHQIAEHAPAVLARMAAAVKPGGWLLVQEPDFHPAPTTEPAAWATTWTALIEWGHDNGVDCFFFSAAAGFHEGNRYSTIQGTSMAAPHVAASLALVASARPSLRKHPRGAAEPAAGPRQHRCPQRHPGLVGHRHLARRPDGAALPHRLLPPGGPEDRRQRRLRGRPGQRGPPIAVRRWSLPIRSPRPQLRRPRPPGPPDELA
jgi:Methyltransferase domain/Subtilase family